MKCLNVLLGTALVVVLGGCAVSAGGLGRETGPVALPAGMALLESEESECEGTVQVGAASVETRGDRDDYFVDPGENATFRLGRGAVEWACIGREVRDFERHSCPARASHVRFTRAAGDDALLLECFG